MLDAPDDAERGWRHFLGDCGNRAPRLKPQDPAVLFYTSGTSGRLKGVPPTQGNLSSNRRALFQEGLIRQEGLIQKDERVLVPLPLHHVYPFAVGMMAALGAGSTIVLVQEPFLPEIPPLGAVEKVRCGSPIGTEGASPRIRSYVTLPLSSGPSSKIAR